MDERDAKAFLRQVEKLDVMITNKLVERSQWREIALGITACISPDKVQSSGAKSKMSNAVDKCVDMEKEIDNLTDKLIDTKQAVISTIERLENPFYYNLLHMKYIQYKTLWEIAEITGKEYSSVKKAHGRALKKVQAILDAKEKNNGP